VKKAILAAIGPLTLALLAGCGGSSKSKSTSAASSPATTSTESASAPATASSTPATTAVALITTKHDKLGTILAFGPKKLTVYLFAADKGKASNCAGACASVGPAVTGQPTRWRTGARSRPRHDHAT